MDREQAQQDTLIDSVLRFIVDIVRVMVLIIGAWTDRGEKEDVPEVVIREGGGP